MIKSAFIKVHYSEREGITVEWKKLDEVSKSEMLGSISTKPIYKVRLMNGSEATVFVKNHQFVMDTYDQKVVNPDDIGEYAIFGK